MKVTSKVLTVEGITLFRCEEVDIDMDIDWLITGACIQITETVFYISADILHENLSTVDIEPGIRQLISITRRKNFQVIENKE